jgi:hypothetical protein
VALTSSLRSGIPEKVAAANLQINGNEGALGLPVDHYCASVEVFIRTMLSDVVYDVGSQTLFVQGTYNILTWQGASISIRVCCVVRAEVHGWAI